MPDALLDTNVGVLEANEPATDDLGILRGQGLPRLPDPASEPCPQLDEAEP